MNEADSILPAEPSRLLLFARVREALGTAASRALREALIAISHELELAADQTSDGRERQALMSASVQLGRDPAGLAARVPEELARRVLRCLENARSRQSGPSLTLLGHEALEAQILAGSLAAAIREAAGVQYEDYVNRVRRITTGDWPDDDANPLGARTIAAAVVTVVAGVAETAGTRLALRQSLCRHAAAPIAAAIAIADAMLESEGIAPLRPPVDPEHEALADDDWEEPADDPPASGNERSPEPDWAGLNELLADPPDPIVPVVGVRQVQPPPGDEGSPPSTPPPQPDRRPIADVADRMAAIDGDAQALASSPLPALREPLVGDALSVLQPVAELERDAIALAHAAGVAPFTPEARREFFGQARGGLSRAGASPAQMAVVDVVAAMFDYVVDDRRVPEPAKPLIWRLQQPALALSLLDPGYLGNEPRSLRRLIEHVGAIAVAFADDLSCGGELHQRLETIVRAVEVVAGALQSRSSVLARQTRREYERAAQSVGQLIERVASERKSLETTPGRRNRRDYSRRPGPDRERLVTERMQALLAERLEANEVPESVSDFLHKVWLRHLRTAALRSGEESSDFRAAMQVVDDLLWSLDARSAGSRNELAERIPPLIRLITQGVGEIGAHDDEYRAFFDELFLIHLRRMQRAGPTDASHRPPVPPAAGPAGASSDEAPASSPAPRAPIAATPGTDQRLLDILGSLDLDDLPADPRRLPLDGEEAFSQLERGDWIELGGREGQPEFAKVAWINQRRTVGLLVRRSDRRAMSMQMNTLRQRFVGRSAFLVATRF